jgi:EspG family
MTSAFGVDPGNPATAARAAVVHPADAHPAAVHPAAVHAGDPHAISDTAASGIPSPANRDPASPAPGDHGAGVSHPTPRDPADNVTTHRASTQDSNPGDRNANDPADGRRNASGRNAGDHGLDQDAATGREPGGPVPAGETDAVTLSALEFDVLWEHLRLEPMPLVLKVPSPGRTYTERRELAARVWQDLEARGLGRPVGLDPRLDRLLRLLEKPQREVDGRFGATRGVRLLVAATGDDAVFAVLSKRGLALSEAPATGLAQQALSVLPPVGAGPGGSVTLRAEHVDAAGRDATTPQEFEAALCAQGVRSADAALMRTMVTQVRRQGQFGASARNRWSHRHRAPYVVGFFDTASGRYLQLRRRSPDGEIWSTISPADNRLLTKQLSDLLAEITAEADADSP